MSDAVQTLEPATPVAAAALGSPTLAPAGIPASRDLTIALSYALLVAGAFCLYSSSALILEAHNGMSSFGADSTLYTEIANGVIEDRLARFHPLTVGLAVAWMKIALPFAGWATPAHLLGGLFAAIGAAGVWAALAAFEVAVPRRYVLICGVIYACSLGVWYFSSISESKIVTATFAAAYIAIYLRLRERWSLRGALWLTAVLGAACLNEIVAAFLIVIPCADTVLKRGWSWRSVRWIAAHGLVIIAAYFLIEVTISGLLTPPAANNLESGSSAKMFWFYAGISDHSLASLYGFLLNWFCFTIAAPTAHAFEATPIWPTYYGYFAPSFLHYFDTLASAALIALAAIMVAAPLLPAWRGTGRRLLPYLPLLGYSLLRGAFFFAFNPAEVMLFSAAIALPHLIMLIAPFAASRFPAKMPVLVGFTVLLAATNLRFILG